MRPEKVTAIIREVAAAYGVQPGDLVMPDNSRRFGAPRREAMARVRATIKIAGKPVPYSQMGLWFGVSKDSIRILLSTPAPVYYTPFADLRQRLTWLYGDPDARMAANAPDVEAWNRLGMI